MRFRSGWTGAGKVVHSCIVNAPLSTTFEYVDDTTNSVDWLFGVEKFTPVTERLRGRGARAEVGVRTGVINLDLNAEVIRHEFERNIDIHMTGDAEATVRFAFEALSGRRTRVTVELNYALPRGLAGKALDLVVRPAIVPALSYTEEHLRRGVEALVVPQSVDHEEGEQ